MKKILVVAVALAAVFSSCGTGGGRLKSEVDSVSYMWGLHTGRALFNDDPSMNINLAAKGLIDGFSDKVTTEKVSADSAVMLLQKYYMMTLPTKRETWEKDYMASVEAKNPNAVKTESGLLYEILEPGDTTVMPVDTDNVTVSYVLRSKEKYDAYLPGKLGRLREKSDSVVMPLGQFVPGWREGLKMLGKGGKMKMWIPSSLAYGQGDRMYGGQMSAYETLVFETVELLDVTPVPAAPATEVAPEAAPAQ